MTKPKARAPRKPIPSTREDVVMEKSQNGWGEGALREAMKKVEECESAVLDSRMLTDTYSRQISSLEVQLNDAHGNLADAKGLLVAREQKLARELEKLRNVTYQMESKSINSKWNTLGCSEANLAKAQCERNY